MLSGLIRHAFNKDT